MLFNSYIFIFAFLPVVFGTYILIENTCPQSWKFSWLVLASFVYYAWWRPAFILLLVISIAVNAGIGAELRGTRLINKPARTAVFIMGLAFNLAVLGYFKYAGLLVASADDWFGLSFTVPNILLPIGISFITFQKIAFLADCYRGVVRNFSLLNFSLFVSFFPQLIAGPIVHHAEVMPQFAIARDRSERYGDFAVGWSLFCIGLFKKVVVADGCAVYANAGYNMLQSGTPPNLGAAWTSVLAYSFQLYFDFSGYSDMAIGLARVFGIRFPVNFHSPYKSSSIVDFWRRWHITLSRFLRDYLYFPLGGNRRGAVRRYVNLMIVMFLGGLWHGANWTFAIWGTLHGILLAINHAWRALPLSKSPILNGRVAHAGFVALTFLAVTLAWIPFRSSSFTEAGQMVAALVPSHSKGAYEFVREVAAVRWFWRSDSGRWLAIVAAATFLLPNSNQCLARLSPVLSQPGLQLLCRGTLERLDWKVATVLATMFVWCVLHLSHVSPFIYFQF
jgi:alginate O-acetyltransferase complex protein AlgI